MDWQKLLQNPNAAKAFLNKKEIEKPAQKPKVNKTSSFLKKKEPERTLKLNDRVFTEKQLDTIVAALVRKEVAKIPKAEDGKTPTKEELQKIITPLIPVLRQPKDGKDGEVTQKHVDDITNRILKQVGKTPDLTNAIVQVFKDEKVKAEDLPGFVELKERVERLAKNQKYQGGRGIASGYTDSDVLRVINANGGFGGSSPLTTKGDLYTYDTDDARLPIGANGEVLTADSAEATGMKWAAVAGTGDVTAASAFGTDNRLIRSDGTGKGVQASGITVSDTDAVSGATIDANNNTISNIALGAEATGAINDLSDVTITTPADNEVLAYDGVSDFINQTPAEAGLATSAQGALADSALQNIVEDTTPQLGGMLDVNGNAIGDGTRELLTFTEDPSAVNHVNIENQATGSGPTISAQGDDANIDLNIFAKGNGQIKFGDNLNLNSVLVEGGILPTADNTYTLGSSTLAYSQIHLSDGGFIAWDNETGFLYCDGTTGAIKIASNGTQAPTISSNGNTDLIIQTGNATTGNITLTDGANGNINIAPDGTGEAQVSGQKIIDESDTASTTAAGIVETATDAEFTTGTDTTRYVTADQVASVTQTMTNKTLDDAKVIGAINAQTGTTYTLVLADASKHVTMTNASANTLTVPPNSSVAFEVGTRIMVQQKGAGSTTIAAGAGVTINAPSTVTLEIGEQYESRGLLKTATDTWELI